MKPDAKLGKSCLRQEEAAIFMGLIQEVVLAKKVMLRQVKVLLEKTTGRTGNILWLYQTADSYSCKNILWYYGA